jgi:hypothetical protein
MIEEYRMRFKDADHDFSGSLKINELYTVIINLGM